MITLDQLENTLAALPRQSIALVGDLFLDRYLEIAPGVREMSIETHLEAYQVTRVRNAPGALGTVMNSLAALGVGKILPVTVIGDDGHGHDLLRSLAALPVDTAGIVRSADRLTPTYTKPMRQDENGNWRELNRLDVRDRGPVSAAATTQLCDRLRRAFAAADALVVLDQIVEPEWGVVNQAVRDAVAELADAAPAKLIYVDSRAHLTKFSRGVLKGNRGELATAAGAPGDQPDAPRRAAEELSRRTGQAVFCTLGAEGILVARPGKETAVAPAYPVTGPIDIVGAGDAATSGIITSLLAGADELTAAAVGNLVASITVQQIGQTGTATPQQVLNRWREMESRSD